MTKIIKNPIFVEHRLEASLRSASSDDRLVQSSQNVSSSSMTVGLK
jgi:hypothetical protein